MSYDILSKDKLEYTLGKIKEKIDASEGGGIDVEAEDDTLVFTGGSKSNEVKLANHGSESSAIRFGIDENGNYGYYKVGADTLTPFKSGSSTLDIFNHGDTIGLKGVVIFPGENTQLYQTSSMRMLDNAQAGSNIQHRYISSDLSHICMEETYYKYLVYPVPLSKNQYNTLHIDVEVPSGRFGSYNNSHIELISSSTFLTIKRYNLTEYTENIFTFDRQIVDMEIPADDEVYLTIFNCDDVLKIYSIWVD